MQGKNAFSGFYRLVLKIPRIQFRSRTLFADSWEITWTYMIEGCFGMLADPSVLPSSTVLEFVQHVIGWYDQCDCLKQVYLSSLTSILRCRFGFLRFSEAQLFPALMFPVVFVFKNSFWWKTSFRKISCWRAQLYSEASGLGPRFSLYVERDTDSAWYFVSKTNKLIAHSPFWFTTTCNSPS